MNISFRPATEMDVNMLFAWRNHPETRQWMKNTDKIAYDDHVRWLATTLQDPACILTIVEQYGYTVGTIRLNLGSEHTTSPVGYLSWTVDPDARRQGIGTAMLTAFVSLFKFCTLFAEIKMINSRLSEWPRRQALCRS